jgi:hypothetical protein
MLARGDEPNAMNDCHRGDAGFSDTGRRQRRLRGGDELARRCSYGAGGQRRGKGPAAILHTCTSTVRHHHDHRQWEKRRPWPCAQKGEEAARMRRQPADRRSGGLSLACGRERRRACGWDATATHGREERQPRLCSDGCDGDPGEDKETEIF